MKNKKIAPIVLIPLIVLISMIFKFCTPPPKKNSTWGRYQQVLFTEVTKSHAGYLSFELENTIRIYTPPNALRSRFIYIGDYSKTPEGELMVLEGKFHGHLSKEQVRKLFMHSVKLSTNGETSWFCVQEPIYEDLLSLESNRTIEVFYQFAGSTNIDGECRLVFAMMAWKEY